MSQRIHFSPLGSGDAGKIARLQRKLFPPILTESVEELRYILENTEKYLVCNLSFGLFDDTRMIGYTFAYVESESLFYGRSEEVVYVKEIALSPGYESWLRPLMLKIFELCAVYCPGAAIEAHAQEDALAKWKRLQRLFSALQMTMQARDEPAREGHPVYKLIRFDFGNAAVSIPERPRPLPAVRWQYDRNVSVGLIQDPRQWLSLKDQWDRLLRTTRDSNVFQSFEYLWQWWKYFGHWNELRVLVIYHGDTVIGIAPLMVERFPIFGKTVRKLMFISAPMEMSRPKFLFGLDANACLPAMLAYLEHTASTWDIFDIDEQLTDPASAAMQAHFRRSGCLVAESSTLCPYIKPTGTWEQFMAARPKKLRSNINRLRRKISAMGEVRVRTVNSWPALKAALDTHCEIEERSWKAEQRLHLSCSKSHFFFYQALATFFGREESFQLRVLECGGQPLASTFGILHGNVFQSLKIAHDSRYDNLSPGTILESYELEDMFRSGVLRYEFMGSFLANKLRWTSTVYETANIHIYKRQARLILFFFIFFVLKRKVKTVLKRTGQFERVETLLGKLRVSAFPRF